MKRLPDTLNDAENLRKLLNENPELPIVFEIDNEVVADDLHETFMAPYASYSVGEILDCSIGDREYPFDGTFTDRDDFEEAIEQLCSDLTEDLNDLAAMMEEEKKRFEPYWRKCILVRCTT